MTKVKDGFWKQLGSKVGSNDYLLKAAGGYIGVGNSSGEVVPLNNGTKNEGLNADMVDGLHATRGNNKPWGTIPAITTSGWMDVGKQFEFHYDNDTGSDYSTILRCTGNYGNIIDLPSSSGILALKSDIPSSLPANGGNADTVDGIDGTYIFRQIRYFNGASDDNTWIKIQKKGQYRAGTCLIAVYQWGHVCSFIFSINNTYPTASTLAVISKDSGNLASNFRLSYSSSEGCFYFKIAKDYTVRIFGSETANGMLDDGELVTSTPVDLSECYNISINVADIARSVDWSGITNKPSSFTPSNHTHDYLPLSGGWMDTGAQIYFKGLNQSTSVWGSIGYRAYSGNGNNTMHNVTSPNNTGALYITTNGYDSANDYGGLAIDNDGVTAFGAGDTGSVFRVLNEDNVSDGAQFYVTKSSGTVSKYTHSISSGSLKVTNNSNTMIIGSQNSSYGHIENSANIPFYFNRSVQIDGAIWRYNTNYGITSDGYFHAKAVYANRDGSTTEGGVSLYSNSDPMTYGIAFRGTGTYGIHGYVTSGNDWATYLTMNDSTTRGWIFRRGSTNVASIAGSGDMAIGQHLKFSNEAHISTNRSTDYHYGYTFNLGDNAKSIGMYSGPTGEAGGVVISPDGCLIYNSSDCGYNLQVRDKDLGDDLTNIATLTFGIEQSGYYVWSRGGFKKNGSDDSYVLLGGGGHKALSDFSMAHSHPYLSFSSIYPSNTINLNDYFSSSTMYRVYYDYSGSSKIQNGPYESDAGAVINFPTYSGTQVYFNYYNNDVKVRTHYNGHITNWATFITSENIGSQHVSYADSAGTSSNSDKLDNIDSTGFLAWTGMSASGGSSAPFQTSVDFFNNTANLNAGARMIYNYPGNEYTILYTRRSDDVGHGSILRWGYPDNYIRMIRMISGSPQTSDWEKISAGYADSAGNSDTIDGYHYNNLPYVPKLAWHSENSGESVNDLVCGTSFYYTTHGAPTNGVVASFTGTHNSYQLQIQGEYYGKEFWYRSKNGDNGTWNAWTQVIDTNNIGSQHVSYADSAGSVAWGNVTGKPSSFNPSSHSHPYLPTIQVTQEQASNDDWIRTHALSTLRGHVYNTHSLEWQYLFGISSGKTYGSILRTSYGNGTPRIQVMGLFNGTWSSWREVAYDDNTVKKDGTGASGTWGINITGNAGYASSAGYADSAGNANTVDGYHETFFYRHRGSYGKSYTAASTEYNLGPGTYTTSEEGFSGTLLSFNSSESASAIQFWTHYSQGNLYYRTSIDSNRWGKTNGEWTRILDSDSYNYYAPTLTGGGASGTWNISITGNAASAISLGSGALKYMCSLYATSTYNAYKITTDWHKSSNIMPTINIRGYAYGSVRTIDCDIVMYHYNNTACEYSLTNKGSYPIRVWQAIENDVQVFYINPGEYFGMFNVFVYGGIGTGAFSNWSMTTVDAVSGTEIGSKPIATSITGNADTVDGQHLITQVSDWNTDSLSIFKSSENSISNAPTTDFIYGLTLRFHRDASTYHTDLVSKLYSDALFFRRKTESGYGSWRELIHSGNIGLQSVDYANSAGNADTVDNKHVTDFYKSGRAYPAGKSDKQWHKVASFTQSISGAQINTGITFYVGEFYLSRTYGILNIQIRNEAGHVNPEFCYVVWSLNNGIDPNEFVVGHSYSGNTVTYNLYAWRNGWSSYNIRKIAEQAWGSDQDVWTCYDAVNGNSNCFASIPESNKYTSSNLTISNPTNWNSIIGKPSSYTPASHTHPYLPLSGGTMSNTNIVTNLNADLLDGNHASAFAASSHNHDGRYLRYEGWWSSGSGQNVDDANGMTFVYGDHGSPNGWGILCTFDYTYNSGYKFQLFAEGYSASGMYYRCRSSDRGGWTSWKTVIDDGNIGSQHVSYANSAGSADYADSAESATQATNLTPENTAHYFRNPNDSTWRGGMIWGSAGSESMSFVVANSGTRFQFVGGSDIASWESSTWQSVNPYLTIYSSGIVTPGSATASEGFIKSGYDNTYVLLAGGGHKAESNLSVSYASSAGSVAWANITEKPFNWSGQSGQPSWLWGSNDGTNYYVWDPSNFSVNYADSAGSASSSTYARYLTCPDTRSSAQAPGDYTATSTGVSFDFKQSSVTGLSGYSGVMTFRPYASGQDWTGGEAHQIAFLAGGGLYHRIGTSSWDSWERILTSANWSSYISIPSAGNGTVTINQNGNLMGTFTLNQSGDATINLTDYYPIRSYTSGLQISSYSGSATCELFVPYATANQAGVVSTETQTFSGQKTFSSIRLRSTDTENFGGYLYFGDASYAYLAELADDQLTLNASKIFLGISGSQKYYIDGTIFRPVTANSTSDSGIALGSSDYRFTCGYFSDKVYAYKGFYESSDERLKKILNSVKINLDDLSKLRKVYYLWKDRTEDGIQLGMIAQDVQRLYPGLVSVDKETGYLSLAYDKLSVLALEAIDVLYKEHKKLKKHVDELEKLLINNKIY